MEKQIVNDIKTLQWLTLCLSVFFVTMFVVFTAVTAHVYTSNVEEIAQLQRRCEQLEKKSRYYDDVMVTYQFFNEKWTATMRGE